MHYDRCFRACGSFFCFFVFWRRFLDVCVSWIAVISAPAKPRGESPRRADKHTEFAQYVAEGMKVKCSNVFKPTDLAFLSGVITHLNEIASRCARSFGLGVRFPQPSAPSHLGAKIKFQEIFVGRFLQKKFSLLERGSMVLLLSQVDTCVCSATIK